MNQAHGSPQEPVTGVRPQAETRPYCDCSYLSPCRFGSYACQISEIMTLKPRTVLEAGIGNGVVSYLLHKAGIQVTTLDIDPRLEPDMLGSVTSIPGESNTFDVVACFQVLEHLPFGTFPTALQELWRVAHRYAVLSLPDVTPYLRVALHLPGVGDFRFLTQARFLPIRRHRVTKEHHWEIGMRDFPLSRVAHHIESAAFVIHKTYRVFDQPYHRVFVLEKIA